VTAFDPASASYLTVLQESWERDGLGRLAGAATCALAVAAVVLVSSARGGDANSTAEMRLRRALSDPLIVSWIAQSQRSQKTSDSVGAELSLAVPAAAVAAADFAQFDTHIKNFDLDCASQVLESIPATNAVEYLYRVAELEMARAGQCVDKSDEQWATVDRAMAMAEEAYAVDPSCAKANEVLASALGLKMGKIKDEKGKLEAVWRLIKLCDAAIEADPTLPTPYHIKGRVQFQVSSISSAIRYAATWIHPKGVPEATAEDALRNLMLAERYMKPRFWHTNELIKAKCYHGMGDPVSARASAQKVLSTEMDPKVYTAETADMLRTRARKLLL
jgi:tetratricopeptide (TPR) repeat protein